MSIRYMSTNGSYSLNYELQPRRIRYMRILSPTAIHPSRLQVGHRVPSGTPQGKVSTIPSSAAGTCSEIWRGWYRIRRAEIGRCKGSAHRVSVSRKGASPVIIPFRSTLKVRQ